MALDVNAISEKLELAEFKLEIEGGDLRPHESIVNSRESIRVYNEVFVRDPLKFIIHPEEGVEPFAILYATRITTSQEKVASTSSFFFLGHKCA